MEAHFVIVQSFPDGEDKTTNYGDDRVLHLPWGLFLREKRVRWDGWYSVLREFCEEEKLVSRRKVGGW